MLGEDARLITADVMRLTRSRPIPCASICLATKGLGTEMEPQIRATFLNRAIRVQDQAKRILRMVRSWMAAPPPAKTASTMTPQDATRASITVNGLPPAGP